MKPKVLIFDKHYIVKNIFHICKEPVSINKVNIKKIVLSKKDLYSNKGALKYFIGYDDLEIDIILLYIILPQMNICVKYFKDNKHINLLVNDKNILQNYNEIWNKKVYLKNSDSEPVYNDKYIKTKISSNNISFYSNKMPKENECYTFLSVILLDSIINVHKKYYPQIFLEVLTFLAKNKKNDK